MLTGYGGGMSSAKAALESDTRVLAYEAGRKFKIRVNTISAGPLGSRAAKAIGFIEDMIRLEHAGIMTSMHDCIDSTSYSNHEPLNAADLISFETCMHASLLLCTPVCPHHMYPCIAQPMSSFSACWLPTSCIWQQRENTKPHPVHMRVLSSDSVTPKYMP